MFTGKTYLLAKDVPEAYEALQKSKTNKVIAGSCWLKMTNKRFGTLIDLSQVGLDQIIEHPQEIEIGAMVTLRQLETSALLAGLWGGILPACVSHIVGIQFRNCATVGGSVYMRAGFSDLLTALLCLDTTVYLHAQGAVPLAQFLEMPYTKDIITHITIKKDGRLAAYQSMRNQETDFPVLSVAASHKAKEWRISVGARPGRAVRAVEAEQLLLAGDLPSAQQAVCGLLYQSNMRASEAYRRKIAGVLFRRAVCQVNAQEEQQ